VSTTSLAPHRLRSLKLKRVSLVDDPANQLAKVLIHKRAEPEPAEKAEMSTANINDLPDSAFAAIEPGGKKVDGKTEPRSLRHLPFKNADGSVNLPHLRNALARLNQTQISAGLKAEAKRKLEAAARSAGVGDHEKRQDMELNKNGATEEPDEDDMMKKGMCPGCDAPVGKGDKYCANCGDKLPMGARKAVKMDLEKIEDPEVRKAVEKMAADLKTAQDLLDEQAKAAAEKKEPEPDVLKSLTPEARAVVEKAQRDAAEATAKANAASAEIEKMHEAESTREYIAKAKDFVSLSLDPEKFGPILKRVHDHKTTEEDEKEILRVLTAANKASKPLMKIVGAGGGSNANTGTATEALNSKARDLIAKSGDKKLSYADALDAVMREEPELWRQHMADSSVLVSNE